MPSEWVTRNQFNPAYLSVMEAKLYFEGDGRIRAITNYAGLLTLATVIATYGLISGSAATVIGAMIVAPLMTPIMATTLAIVLGNAPRLGRSVGIVGLSVTYVIGLAFLLSMLIPALTIGFGTNPEILGRVSPNMIALYAALGSGAAGAFALSREEIGDALPGVAIAISLVPPLCVVGLCLSHARWLDGLGALVLFLTNFFAIVLAGGAVFWISGIHISGIHAGRVGQSQDQLRGRAVAVALAGTIIVSAILGFNGYRTLEITMDTSLAEKAIDGWLEGTRYIVRDVVLTYHPGDILVRGPARVTVRIAGTGAVPPIDLLAADLEERLGYRVVVELRTVPEEIQYYPNLLRPLTGNETNPVDTAATLISE